jgi:hypothetical protein
MLSSGSYASEDQVIDFVENLCAGKLITFGGTPTVEVSVTASSADPQLGDTLTVTVSYEYSGFLLYTLINSGKDVNLSATTTMVYE